MKFLFFGGIYQGWRTAEEKNGVIQSVIKIDKEVYYMCHVVISSELTAIVFYHSSLRENFGLEIWKIIEAKF